MLSSFIVDQFVMKCFFCISYLDLLSPGVPMTFNILKGKMLTLAQIAKHKRFCNQWQNIFWLSSALAYIFVLKGALSALRYRKVLEIT
jgi:hypothetical protein